MIDTLQLHPQDYRIGLDTSLIVQPSAYVEGSGQQLDSHLLWRKPTGEEVVGSKAYHNSEVMNVSLKPYGLFVSFSIPKVYTGRDNYYSVGRAGSKAIVGRIEKELAGIGVHTTINQASISRLDSFKNIEAEETYSNYHALFGLLQAKRTQKRDYGTTFLWSNTQQELCVYDKLEEMRAKGQDTTGLPVNTIRFEHRLLKARKVESVLGVDSVGDLWANYDRVKETFLQVVGGSLFKYEVEEVEVMTGRQLEEELLFWRDRYQEQNWLHRYLKTMGLRYLLERADMEVIREVVQRLAGDRKKAYRLLKDLEQGQFEIAMVQQACSSRRTNSQLYAELKRKVLAA